jgi:pilus assembly protein CpaC
MTRTAFNPLGTRAGATGATLYRLIGCALVATALAFAGAQSAAAAGASHVRVSAAEIGQTQYLEVGLNKSVIVDLPAHAQEVIVSQPNVASAIMRTQDRAILQGISIGETNIFFLDANGNRIAVLEVAVVQDAAGLSATIGRLVPGSNIEVESFGQRLVLSGTANSGDDVNKAVAIAEQFAGGDVVSVINVLGAQQVMLKVTVAEVQRETVKQLGIDLDASVSAGGLSTSLINSPGLGGASGVIATNSKTVNIDVGALSIEATLNALERQGALRTLAEPTLTALSGQEAEFLAGGEFPVPVGVDNNQIIFEFKRFGVDLTFTPTVHSDNVISLDVDTTVSELSTEGGFSAGGVTIPATKERTARTSVQLPSGGTLAIAGLMEDKIRQQFNQLPGIGSVPILGALFRSRDFIHSQTELLILVTPYLTEPGVAADYNLPTDNIVFAGDAEAVFLGHLEALYGVGEGGGNYKGNVGFVLD